MKIESGIALPLHQKINFVFSAATKFIHQIKYHNNFFIRIISQLGFRDDFGFMQVFSSPQKISSDVKSSSIMILH